jgi:hypothetical protein
MSADEAAERENDRLRKAGVRLQEASCVVMNFTDEHTDGEKSGAWVELDNAEKQWDAALTAPATDGGGK